MKYDQIVTALDKGYKVYWINSAYKVFFENGRLCSIYKYNSYMTALIESEYKDCFIQ